MLNRASRLRVPEAVVTRKVGEETVILDLESGNYFALDRVGGRVIELLAEESSLASVIDTMLGEYEVAPAELEADVIRLSEELLSSGLVQES